MLDGATVAESGGVQAGAMSTDPTSAEKVHITYLRLKAGVGDGCIEVLMCDFNLSLLSCVTGRYACSAMVSHAALQCMSNAGYRLARCA